MRIRAREPIKAYFNYQVHELEEGQVVKGGLAEYLAEDPRVEVLDQPTPAPQQDGALDIEATIPQVLEWVGDDPEKAAEAREAESARDKPRSTLLAQLDEIIND
ncbi:hypothetical protein ACFYUV_20575 [Nonomuraea sp. NPDC003560]|uniref:hypothetical protein n=1 Tax=Nonomuraea sp. NPDC003560 TaxID=3364341 RepID=UPI0036A26EA8